MIQTTDDLRSFRTGDPRDRPDEERASCHDDGATRVRLSTRSTDGRYAIPNYEAGGFRYFRTEWEPAPVHPDGDPD